MFKKILSISTLFLLVISLFGCTDANLETIESPGESTIMLNATGKVERYNAKEIMYILAGKLYEDTNYIKKVNGESKTILPGSKETISNTTYKIDNTVFSTLYSEDVNMKVNYHHQLYYSSRDNYKFRNSNFGNVEKTNLDQYRNIYGVIPGDRNFTGYVINDDTLLEYFFLSSESTEELSVYKYTIDVVKATTAMRIQMKQLGDLTNYPDFSSVELKLTIDNNWNVVSIETIEKYKVEKLGLNFNCVQILVTIFEYLKDTDLPDLSDFLK